MRKLGLMLAVSVVGVLALASSALAVTVPAIPVDAYGNSLGEETFQPSTEVGLLSSLREDIYVMYAGSPDGTEKARLTLIITPLVVWFWLGGAVLVLGGVLAMWPGGPEIRAKVRSRQGATQAGYAASLSDGGGA